MQRIFLCVVVLGMATTVGCGHAPIQTQPAPVTATTVNTPTASPSILRLGNIFSDVPPSSPWVSPHFRLGNIF